MQTLKERIEELMTAMSWSVPDVARVAQVSRSAVAQWRGQGSKQIHTIGRVDVAQRLADASGYSALWIAKGEGPKKVAAIAWPFSSPYSIYASLPAHKKAALDQIVTAFLAADDAVQQQIQGIPEVAVRRVLEQDAIQEETIETDTKMTAVNEQRRGTKSRRGGSPE